MPSGAKKRRAARRKMEQEARRFNCTATDVNEKEEKSSESNVEKPTDLLPEPPVNESLPETSIGFVSVKDSVSISTEEIPAQIKLEETSMDDVVRLKSIENEEKEDKIDQIQDRLSETIKSVEKIEKSEIPESSEPKAPIVRKTSWLSCCGLFNVLTRSDS